MNPRPLGRSDLPPPSITAPIASATSPAQLDALVAAAHLQLDAPSLALIDRVSQPAA